MAVYLIFPNLYGDSVTFGNFFFALWIKFEGLKIWRSCFFSFLCISNNKMDVIILKSNVSNFEADIPCYNLTNNFSIIACGARRARPCATAYLLTGAQHTLRAGIVRVDRELFHQIIAYCLMSLWTINNSLTHSRNQMWYRPLPCYPLCGEFHNVHGEVIWVG